MRGAVCFLAGLALGLLAVMLLPRGAKPALPPAAVVAIMPPAADSAAVGEKAVMLPLARSGSHAPKAADSLCCKAEKPKAKPSCEPDSALVRIPITAKTYEGEGYRLQVSGFEPRLDSITLLLPSAEAKPRRWHLGLSAGCAFTPAGCQPCIGLTLTYSFVSF